MKKKSEAKEKELEAKSEALDKELAAMKKKRRKFRL